MLPVDHLMFLKVIHRLSESNAPTVLGASRCLSWPPRPVFPAKNRDLMGYFLFSRNRPILRQDYTLFLNPARPSRLAGDFRQNCQEMSQNVVKSQLFSEYPEVPLLAA